MEHDEGLGEDEPIGPLLPPDDRLWRHPSEVTSVPAPPPRRVPSAPRLWLVGVLSGLIGALLATGAIAALGGLRTRTDRIHTVVQRETPAVPVAANLGQSITDIAERVLPSIVQVKAQPDDKAMGSAVVFRSDGHALTSAQVVGTAERVRVVRSDGAERWAEVVGVDRATDVAVLKLQAAGAVPAALGSQASLKVGHVAIAVGASVSVGIISALGQEVELPDGALLLDMIQTDAPIQAGSAGGALLDGSGAVIGITTTAGGSGWATPIDVARDTAEQLISTGTVAHAWLGLEGDDLSRAVAQRMGIDGAAKVTAVRKGSPAAAAGVRVGDVITAVDGAHVASMAALKVSLRARRPGQTVELLVRRGAEEVRLRVTLIERPRTS